MAGFHMSRPSLFHVLMFHCASPHTWHTCSLHNAAARRPDFESVLQQLRSPAMAQQVALVAEHQRQRQRRSIRAEAAAAVHVGPLLEPRGKQEAGGTAVAASDGCATRGGDRADVGAIVCGPDPSERWHTASFGAAGDDAVEPETSGAAGHDAAGHDAAGRVVLTVTAPLAVEGTGHAPVTVTAPLPAAPAADGYLRPGSSVY